MRRMRRREGGVIGIHLRWLFSDGSLTEGCNSTTPEKENGGEDSLAVTKELIRSLDIGFSLVDWGSFHTSQNCVRVR